MILHRRAIMANTLILIILLLLRCYSRLFPLSTPSNLQKKKKRKQQHGSQLQLDTTMKLNLEQSQTVMKKAPLCSEQRGNIWCSCPLWSVGGWQLIFHHPCMIAGSWDLICHTPSWPGSLGESLWCLFWRVSVNKAVWATDSGQAAHPSPRTG